MKKRLIIAGAVAGYLLIEGFFLLAPTDNSLFVDHEQLVLVSTAGMLSALFLGGRPSAKRALTVVLGVIGTFTLFVGIAVTTELASRAGLNFDLVFFGLTAAATAAFVVFRVLRRRRSLDSEANEWLQRRKEAHDRPARLNWRKIQNIGLWIPSISVILLLFFWSLSWGVITRVSNVFVEDKSNYRVRIPTNWIVSRRNGFDGTHTTFAWKLHNTPRATLLFWRESASVSRMAIHAHRSAPPPDLSKWRREISPPANVQTRTFNLGVANITCDERDSFRVPGQLSIYCTSSDGLLDGWFLGDRGDARSFYQIVSIAVPKPEHLQK